MGGCFTKDEDVNPSLSGLNDSRHVMMRRSSLKKQEPVPMDGSAYKPRPAHKLPKDLEIAFEMEKEDDDDELTTNDDHIDNEKKNDKK